MKNMLSMFIEICLFTRIYNYLSHFILFKDLIDTHGYIAYFNHNIHIMKQIEPFKEGAIEYYANQNHFSVNILCNIFRVRNVRVSITIPQIFYINRMNKLNSIVNI